MVEKKKVNRPARIAKRNKQSYAQYVWVREIFNRMDDINARVKAIEDRLDGLETTLGIRNIYKGPSSNIDSGEDIRD